MLGRLLKWESMYRVLVLAFLIRIRNDPKTAQTLLRHSDVTMTQFYRRAVSQYRMMAAGEMLTAILSHATDQSGLKADRGRVAVA